MLFLKKLRWFAMVLIVAFAHPDLALWADGLNAQSAGTVALISGEASIRHGNVTLTPEPSVTYTDTTDRQLGPNDNIAPGDVIVTGDDSYLKIYYKDDSIMDVGPNTTIKVSTFVVSGSQRNIAFDLVDGKVRTLVTRSLDTGNSYRVSTPISSMSVHGTEWVTHCFRENNQTRLDVTVLEGKVVVDAPRNAHSTESIPVTPGRAYAAVGSGGMVTKYNVAKLSTSQIADMIAMIPGIETKRSTVAASQLPGTGLGGSAPPGPTDDPAVPDPDSVGGGRDFATINGASPGSTLPVAGGATTATFLPVSQNTGTSTVSSGATSSSAVSAATRVPAAAAAVKH